MDSYPLILAVQGPPGDGKSYQTNLALRSGGFRVFRMSSALLAGNLEGEPVKRLKALYERANESAEFEPDSPPAIVLEDFDLSPAGQRADTRYTVNSQLLSGFLMNLADDVGSCDVGTDRRIPIFMTGNNFTTIHGPLARPGRINFFTWEPSKRERAQILTRALDTLVEDLTFTRAEALVKRYSKLTISSFVAAAHDGVATKIYNSLVAVGQIHLASIQHSLDDGFCRISVDELDTILLTWQNGERFATDFLEGR